MTDRCSASAGVRVGWGGAVAVLLLAWPAAHAAEPALVIQGVSLFDTASGAMKPNRTIVVSGEKIEAVGTPEQPAAVPAGAVLLDGKGKFVIPGLIDAHVHLVHRLNYAHMTGDEVWSARINPNPRPIEVWGEHATWPLALEIRADSAGATGMMAEELRCFCRVVGGQQAVPVGVTYGDALQVQQ